MKGVQAMTNQRKELTAVVCCSGERLPVICLVAAAILVAAPGAAEAASRDKPLTDSAITLAVEGDLNIDEGVLPNDVDVNTTHGIVTLSGSVSDLLAKKRAVRIAESIRGVRAVIDQITVTPVSRPDPDIQKDIVAALHEDPATENYPVVVTVKDAVATLTGSVGSWAESQLARRIAEGVKGVKEVRNDIQINFLTKPTDQEIAADVTERLDWDIWVNGDLIKVTVNNGHVTLNGAVGSVAERRRATDDAWVNGVTSVDDTGLTVDKWARDQGRRKYRFVLKSDDEIKRAMEAAFRRDPRVTPFPPQVTVEAGLATLSGTVGNLAAKVAAEQDARNTVGVSWVDDLVKVRPKNIPIDADAEKSLNAALERDPRMAGSRIEVAVINHAAYLGGWADSALQRKEAQDIASRTKGVVEVRNHLRIEPASGPLYSNGGWPSYEFGSFGPPPLKTDAQIKKSLEKEFFWSPFVDRHQIHVNVHDGVVTLTGTVWGWLAYGEAYRDALKCGAVDVRDHLNVKQGAWF
jgi:osmotically-inducible protein OsmY